MVYGFLILLFSQLAYLPDRKREYVTEEDAGSYASELSVEGRDEITNLDELVKDFKRNRKRGMLGWFKLKVCSCASKRTLFICVYFEMDLVCYDVILVLKRDNHGISLIHYCSCFSFQVSSSYFSFPFTVILHALSTSSHI